MRASLRLNAVLSGRCADELKRRMDDEGCTQAEAIRQLAFEARQRSLGPVMNAVNGDLNVIRLSTNNLRHKINKNDLEGQQSARDIEAAIVRITGLLRVVTSA